MKKFFCIAEDFTGQYYKGQIIEERDSFFSTPDRDIVCVPDTSFSTDLDGKVHAGAYVNMDLVVVSRPLNFRPFEFAHIPSLDFNSPVLDPGKLLPSTETLPAIKSIFPQLWGFQVSKPGKTMLLQKTVNGTLYGIGPDAVVRLATNEKANWWNYRGLIYSINSAAFWDPVADHWAAQSSS